MEKWETTTSVVGWLRLPCGGEGQRQELEGGGGAYGAGGPDRRLPTPHAKGMGRGRPGVGGRTGTERREGRREGGGGEAAASQCLIHIRGCLPCPRPYGGDQAVPFSIFQKINPEGGV